MNYSKNGFSWKLQIIFVRWTKRLLTSLVEAYERLAVLRQHTAEGSLVAQKARWRSRWLLFCSLKSLTTFIHFWLDFISSGLMLNQTVYRLNREENTALIAVYVRNYSYFPAFIPNDLKLTLLKISLNPTVTQNRLTLPQCPESWLTALVTYVWNIRAQRAPVSVFKRWKSFPM